MKSAKRSSMRLEGLGLQYLSNADDRAFFKRHRTRHYRVRMATQDEIEAFGETIQPGDFVFCAVKRITMNRRLRTIFAAPPEFAQRFLHDERAARFLYEETVLGRLPATEFADIIECLGGAKTTL